MGALVDRIVDALGFDGALVERMFEQFLINDTLSAFMASLQPEVPESEAEMFGDFMAIPADHRLRRRHVKWIRRFLQQSEQ